MDLKELQCPVCKAFPNCCITAQKRLEMMTDISQIIRNQSANIIQLTTKLEEANQVIADLRKQIKL